MGGEVACPGLSPQRTWEKARSQTTDIVQILFEAFPLLPQINTPQTSQNVLAGSLPSAPTWLPAPPSRPQSLLLSAQQPVVRPSPPL